MDQPEHTRVEHWAMEIAILLESGDPLKYKEAHESQMNLQGYIGFDQARELLDQAKETLSMVIPKRKPRRP